MGTTREPGTWCGGRDSGPRRCNSLVMAGAFDGVTANRRAGPVGRRAARPAPEKRAEGPASVQQRDNIPELARLHRPREDGRESMPSWASIPGDTSWSL